MDGDDAFFQYAPVSDGVFWVRLRPSQSFVLSGSCYVYIVDGKLRVNGAIASCLHTPIAIYSPVWSPGAQVLVECPSGEADVRPAGHVAGDGDSRASVPTRALPHLLASIIGTGHRQGESCSCWRHVVPGKDESKSDESDSQTESLEASSGPTSTSTRVPATSTDFLIGSIDNRYWSQQKLAELKKQATYQGEWKRCDSDSLAECLVMPGSRVIAHPPSSNRTSLSPLTIYDSWKRTLAAVVSDRDSQQTTPVVVAFGSKNAGKSSFTTYLLNGLLGATAEHNPAVCYAECDMGQGMFDAPGIMALYQLQAVAGQSPLVLRPAFATSAQPRDLPEGKAHNHTLRVLHSECYGHNQTGKQPVRYLRLLSRCLASYFDRAPEGAPLVINTQGWVTGLGLQLLCTLVRLVAQHASGQKYRLHLVHMTGKAGQADSHLESTGAHMWRHVLGQQERQQHQHQQQEQQQQQQPSGSGGGDSGAADLRYRCFRWQCIKNEKSDWRACQHCGEYDGRSLWEPSADSDGEGSLSCALHLVAPDAAIPRSDSLPVLGKRSRNGPPGRPVDQRTKGGMPTHRLRTFNIVLCLAQRMFSEMSARETGGPVTEEGKATEKGSAPSFPVGFFRDSAVSQLFSAQWRGGRSDRHTLLADVGVWLQRVTPKRLALSRVAAVINPIDDDQGTAHLIDRQAWPYALSRSLVGLSVQQPSGKEGPDLCLGIALVSGVDSEWVHLHPGCSVDQWDALVDAEPDTCVVLVRCSFPAPTELLGVGDDVGPFGRRSHGRGFRGYGHGNGTTPPGYMQYAQPFLAPSNRFGYSTARTGQNAGGWRSIGRHRGVGRGGGGGPGAKGSGGGRDLGHDNAEGGNHHGSRSPANNRGNGRGPPFSGFARGLQRFVNAPREHAERSTPPGFGGWRRDQGQMPPQGENARGQMVRQDIPGAQEMRSNYAVPRKRLNR